MRSVKYLEFFEALLDPQTGGISDAQIAEQIKGTDISSLVGEALSLDEQLNRLQQAADQQVIGQIDEILEDAEILELALTPN